MVHRSSHRRWNALFAVATAFSTFFASITAAQSAVQLSHISINSGLSVSVSGRTITVSPGSVYVNDQLVNVPQQVTLVVPDCPNGFVKDEKSKIYAQGKGNPPCMPVKAHATDNDYAPLAYVVPPAAMKVKDAPGANAHYYKNGTDYVVDQLMGVVYRPPSSAISEGQTVYLDYAYFQKRLDTIAVDARGKVSLVPGTPARSAPEPAVLDSSSLALAHVVAAPGNLAIKEDDVLPISCSDCRNFSVDRQANRAALKKTLEKLQAGQPVRIAFWGDSITAGCDASRTDLGFADVFAARLRQKYPKAKFGYKNCGVGGSTTTSRMDKMEKEVLSLKPDLVIIEFVNDVRLQKEELERNYGHIAERFKDQGIEVILINPHQPAPVLVNAKEWRAVPTQYYYSFARKFCKDNNWALADVENRWELLTKEGLKPDLMLVDNLVHINDIGHSIYADTIMNCLI